MITSLSDMYMYLFFSEDAYSRLENDVARSGAQVNLDDYMPVPVISCVKTSEVRKRAAAQKAKLFISSTLKDSRLTLTGEKTPQTLWSRVVATESV